MVTSQHHNPRLRFTLEAESPGTRARAGTFQTLHGAVQTPVFMPVGTQATVKAQTVESLQASGAHLLLANTYHLLLRPGIDVFKKFAGIHRFMNWPGPVLTDSGGYQIFSLPHAREMNEAGARFKSYVDGKSYLLSPESSIAMQQTIGSDVMMALDQCIQSSAGYIQAQAAMELTHRWAQRSLAARKDSPAALFGIVQGAGHPELRKASATFLRELPFDGLAIGGLAVGETHAERYDLTELVTEHLPNHLPRYLMGVGTPADIARAVSTGIDMFDCILPTRLGRNAWAFTSGGMLKIRNAEWKEDQRPLDPACDCPCCRTFSRAYLRHCFNVEEILGLSMLSLHNIHYYVGLMKRLRVAIRDGTLAKVVEEEARRCPPLAGRREGGGEKP